MGLCTEVRSEFSQGVHMATAGKKTAWQHIQHRQPTVFVFFLLLFLCQNSVQTKILKGPSATTTNQSPLYTCAKRSHKDHIIKILVSWTYLLLWQNCFLTTYNNYYYYEISFWTAYNSNYMKSTTRTSSTRGHVPLTLSVILPLVPSNTHR